MVSRCANPDCTAKFRYLSRGRLFHLYARIRGERSAFRRESYWLCDACAPRLTVVARSDGTVEVQKLAVDDLARASQPITAMA